MRAIAIVVMVGACYSPRPQPGVPCHSDLECPSELRCENGFCGGGPDGTIDAPPQIVDADLTCQCADSATLQCSSGPVACALGCIKGSPDRCARIVPSNGVDVSATDSVTMPITIIGVATFNTDDGSITGAITRGSGVGVIDGIGYAQRNSGGVMLGVFVFANLTVVGTGQVHFVGARSVVFLVGGSADIAGRIDGGGGCYGTDHRCAGPGGGAGGTTMAAAGGCGPGGPGSTDVPTTTDGGGGGGGGGLVGGAGAAAGPVLGGAAGSACIAATLVPLVGGSGGGAGGPGASAAPGRGGGGGGALQLSALDHINVSGVIAMGGAGGEGGPGSGANAAAGNGGGAGGGILLEAPAITFSTSAVLAANGGGGGGGGNTSVSGVAGESAKPSGAIAGGGAPGNTPATAGGAGGANTTAAQASVNAPGNANGGGGGGAVGRIYLRALSSNPGSATVISPPAGTGTITGQ